MAILRAVQIKNNIITMKERNAVIIITCTPDVSKEYDKLLKMVGRQGFRISVDTIMHPFEVIDMTDETLTVKAKYPTDVLGDKPTVTITGNGADGTPLKVELFATEFEMTFIK